MSERIETLLHEQRTFPPPDAFRRHAHVKDAGVYKRARSDREGYWAEWAQQLEWIRPWDRVLEWQPPHAKWFVGGKLNVSANCLDRHVRGAKRDKVALHWEGEPGDIRRITYGELHAEVNRCANALKQLGVAQCEPEAMDSEDPLYILYTSGTTGKPKGILHTTGGYLTQAYATTKWVFDLTDDDVFWCTADVGWVTGHSYVVYGPLALGVTQVMYEGAPDHPVRDRFWDICQRHGVTVFYTAPTAIRAFMKWGTDLPAKHDLSKLRLLGSVGEPINPEAWMWYQQHIGGGRCPIVDTWWQTETGGIMITPLPGVTATKPGSATVPFPGIEAVLLDGEGNEVKVGGGYLAIPKPWPGMLR